MNEHTKIFWQYFERQFWGNRAGTSGPNSDLSRTAQLRRSIERILNRYHIHSIVDAGCGDANLFRDIDLTGRVYLGLDCVPGLIALNREVFKHRRNMFFEVADVVSDPSPQADLMICRDVVHYLPNNLIQTLLENARQAVKYLLITHNTKNFVS